MTLEQLQKEFAALPPARDVPNTPRAQEEAWQKEQALTRRINLARMATSMIAETDPILADLKKQHADLTAIRKELSAEPCSSSPSTRAEMDRSQGLKISISGIDGRFDFQNEAYPETLPLIGKLQKRGYVTPPSNPLAGLYGPLPSIEQRLKELQKRRDEAQQQLDAALRDAPSPMSERPSVSPVEKPLVGPQMPARAPVGKS